MQMNLERDEFLWVELKNEVLSGSLCVFHKSVNMGVRRQSFYFGTASTLREYSYEAWRFGSLLLN